MTEALALAAAYLLGSVPFGFLLAKSRGIDLRTVGSGNIGATNAMRALGKPMGLLVFVLDAAKGALPAWAALAVWHRHEGWALALGAAAVIGHSFPVWLGFKGGKGVATACGTWLAIAPLPCLATLGVFALALAATRYVSLSSVLAACALPLALKAEGSRPGWLVMGAVAMAALIVLRHRPNLVRIAAGVEPRVGAAKKEVA